MAPSHERYPRVVIDLGLIRKNTALMMEACRESGVEVMGVTKGVAGDPRIARTLVEEGVSSLGDSRLDNLERLVEADLGVPLWLLRAPSPSEAAACVALAGGSLQSDLGTLRMVSDQARRRRVVHHVLLMVDLGTGREGLDPADLPSACREVSAMEGIVLDGLGVYFDFKRTPSSLVRDLEALSELSREAGVPAGIVSGGASNVLELVIDGSLPKAVNHLRLGTAPLLGLFSSHGPRPIDGWARDTVVAEAEIIEVKRPRNEAIASLGHLDAPMAFLFPEAPAIELLRQSNDHTVLRTTQPMEVGERIRFRLGYDAMARLAASPFTRTSYRED